MASYKLLITPAAAKELSGLSRKKDRQAVTDRIQRLAQDPRPSGCVKLSGADGLYRVRQGQYRIVYSVEDGRLVIVVIRVADRKNVYEKNRKTRSSSRARPFKSNK